MRDMKSIWLYLYVKYAMKSFLYIGFTFTYENMRMMLRLYIHVSTRDTVGYET